MRVPFFYTHYASKYLHTIKEDINMKITENVHRLRIDFQVTDQVKRFVYIYLITGESCYLIDSGVAGSETIIEKYMQSIGRGLKEVRGIFLTHAHPDHIGSAAAVKELTGCHIYCSLKEQGWIQDIDLQFRERPIPNFYRLAGKSVQADQIVKDGDEICLEDGIKLEVMETDGHSKGDVSYLLNKKVLFSGDALPTEDEFPIFVDVEKSIHTLQKIKEKDFEICCPAWDRVYRKSESKELLQGRIELLERLQMAVAQTDDQYAEVAEEEKTRLIAECMQWRDGVGNPLFATSVSACRKNR